jgi:VWFA-related protein
VIRPRSFVLVCLTAALGLGPAGSAQRPAQSTSPQTIRSGVEVVEVAAIVRDGDGRFVTDLSAADFQIVDGGVPQTIVGFDRVSVPRTRGDAKTTSSASDVPPDVASNERTDEARIFMLVLDAIHVDSRRSRTVRDYAKSFLENHVGASDLVAVVSPGGLPQATQDFTTDRPRLHAAIEAFAGNKLQSASVEIERERLVTEVPLHAGRDPSDPERANRAESLSGVLDALAAHLGRIPGRRKSLLLFSEGIDYDVLDVMGVLQRRSSDVRTAIDRAIGALMRTNVALYAIDPRALGSAEGDLVETPVFRTEPSLIKSSVQAEYADSIRGLRRVAESTGGFAAVDRNDIGPAFDRIIDESSEYYVLGYVPSKPPRRGEFRAIDVLVSRPGLRITARKGYGLAAEAPPARFSVDAPEVAVPPGMAGRPRTSRIDPTMPTVAPAPPREIAGVASELTNLLASPLPRAGLPIRIQAVPLRGSGRRTAVHVIVEVLGRTLRFAENGGRFEETVDLAMVTVNDRARAENGKSTRIALRLTPEERERVAATGVRWLARLDLEPGRHQIRVAGRATRTAETGMITHDVDVPRFEPDRMDMSAVSLTSMTSVLMPTRGDGWLKEVLETPPSAVRRFKVGDRLRAAVEVYLPTTATAAIAINSHVAWPDGPRSGMSRRLVPQPRADSRTAAMGFEIDTSPFPPGRYVFEVALDPTGPTPVTRRVAFEIVH